MKRTALFSIALALLAGPAMAQGTGWVTLLDSSNMGDWDRLGAANWRLEGGAVVADKKQDPKENGNFLVTKKSYKDFEIRTEFWVSDDANSGVFIRCENGKVTARDCYEVNIFDQRPDPSYGTGAITDDVARVDPMPKAGGKWNTFEITAKGTHLVVVLNGQKTVDIQNSKHAQGPIGLQYGQGIVKFRKVQIRSLQ
jgi:hypothetical protein